MDFKKIISLLTILFLAVFIWKGCSNDSEEKTTDTELTVIQDTINSEDTIDESAATKKVETIDSKTGETIKPIPKPKPVDNPDRDKIREEERPKSIFVTLDCCKTYAKEEKKCCCDNILEKYKDLLQKQENSTGKLKADDPFLKDCVQDIEYLKRLEALENEINGADDDIEF